MIPFPKVLLAVPSLSAISISFILADMVHNPGTSLAGNDSPQSETSEDVSSALRLESANRAIGTTVGMSSMLEEPSAGETFVEDAYAYQS